jgi:hypothetical protein
LSAGRISSRPAKTGEVSVATIAGLPLLPPELLAPFSLFTGASIPPRHSIRVTYE